jgi:hypothetical protein
MRKRAFLLLLTLSGACTDATKSTSDTTTLSEQLHEITSEKIEQFSGRLDELLTLEMASNAINLPAVDAEKNYQQMLKSSYTHSVSYSWKNGRTRSIEISKNVKPMEVPVDDSIELAWVKPTTLETFKRDYRTPTEAELNQLDSIAAAQTAKAELEGKVDKEQSKIATSMVSSFAKGISYTEIPNVGTYALWDDKYNQLIVFYRGIEFKIKTDTGQETSKEQAISIQVAKDIIEQQLQKL